MESQTLTYALQELRKGIAEAGRQGFFSGRKVSGREVVGVEAIGAGQYESLMAATSVRAFSGVIYGINRTNGECIVSGGDSRHCMYHFTRRGDGDLSLISSEEAPEPSWFKLKDTVACDYDLGVGMLNGLEDKLGIRKKLIVAPPALKNPVRVVA